MGPYILHTTRKVELTNRIHKIIVSGVASAHELRSDQIQVYQVVGITLLKSGIFRIVYSKQA